MNVNTQILQHPTLGVIHVMPVHPPRKSVLEGAPKSYGTAEATDAAMVLTSLHSRKGGIPPMSGFSDEDGSIDHTARFPTVTPIVQTPQEEELVPHIQATLRTASEAQRPLSKEEAFKCLSLRLPVPGIPIRTNASPIYPDLDYFYVNGSEKTGGSAAIDANILRVSFQSVVKSDCWWATPPVPGQPQRGVVARHMGRRVRSQKKRKIDSDIPGADCHGFAGRWFCLIERKTPTPEAEILVVPGVLSLVQIWPEVARIMPPGPNKRLLSGLKMPQLTPGLQNSSCSLRDMASAPNEGRIALWTGDAEWLLECSKDAGMLRPMMLVQCNKERQACLCTDDPEGQMMIVGEYNPTAYKKRMEGRLEPAVLCVVEGEAFVFCKGTVKAGDSLAPSGMNDGVAVAVKPGARRLGTSMDNWSPTPDMVGAIGIVRARFLAPRKSPPDQSETKPPPQQQRL